MTQMRRLAAMALDVAAAAPEKRSGSFNERHRYWVGPASARLQERAEAMIVLTRSDAQYDLAQQRLGLRYDLALDHLSAVEAENAVLRECGPLTHNHGSLAETVHYSRQRKRLNMATTQRLKLDLRVCAYRCVGGSASEPDWNDQVYIQGDFIVLDEDQNERGSTVWLEHPETHEKYAVNDWDLPEF